VASICVGSFGCKPTCYWSLNELAQLLYVGLDTWDCDPDATVEVQPPGISLEPCTIIAN
jgi:hypothetical protein